MRVQNQLQWTQFSDYPGNAASCAWGESCSDSSSCSLSNFLRDVADHRLSLGNESTDVIYLPSIPKAAGSEPWRQLSGNECSKNAPESINRIMQEQTYSKDPGQVAYTTGVFWLFQNAVVKDVQNTSENKHSLNFASNRQWISSRVSIPRMSALITFAGCVALLITAILVSEWVILTPPSSLLHKRSQQ